MTRKLLVAAALGAASTIAALCPSAAVEMTEADRKTLAEMALQWAVDGGIADVTLLKDPSVLIVASINLPEKAELQVPQRTVTVLSLAAIQARADTGGDFLYFRFGTTRSTKQGARVPIALVWAVAADSKTQYLSGGGATLEFEKREATWRLLPVTEQWMS